ncbi:MAG TPA: ATP-grasp domain-containing protein, partial [Candidatus Manganitrophaceae bacterium]
PEILIQEYIPGRDDQIYFFDTYFDARSEPLGYFIGRRIRTFPMGCGVSSMAETARHPEIARVALSALRRIRYRGAAHIDFKIDGRDRSPRLLEINPRFGLAIDLGARAGVNLPAMAYDSLLNRPVPPSDAYSTGIKWIHVKQDIKAFLQYRAAEEWKATDWVRSFLGPKMFRIWSPRDPWPFIISLGRFFRRRLQQPFKSLERKGSPLMAPPSRPRDAPRGGDPPAKGPPRQTEPDNRLQSTPPRN